MPYRFKVRLNRHVRIYDAGRTLVGGAPTTVAFLTEAAADYLRDRQLQAVDGASSVLAERLLDLGMADPVIDDPAQGDLTAVTVVIPIRDRARQLACLLSSIADGVRVIVVDDSSQDPSAIRRVATAYGAELVRHRRNAGPAAARNTGLRLVRTPYVAFIDSDVVLEPGALEILVRHLHDEKVGLAAPRVLGLDGMRRTSWIQRYENSRASLDLGPYPSLVRPRAPVAWVPSACVVARVAALGEGFNADLRVAEDVDLVWRLAEQGWRVRYEPQAVVRHEHRAEFRDWWTRKAYYGTGAHLLAEHHGRSVAPAVLAPWTAAVALALLAQRRWSVPVVGLLTASSARGIARKAHASPQAQRIGVRLAAEGVVATLSQTSALMLRHWWPVAAMGGLLSGRMRRAIVVAALTDTAIELRRTRADLDPVRFAIARRLDDLAYGSGVWMGALRNRSFKCLLPDVRRAGHRT